jgi:hypothetical protein
MTRINLTTEELTLLELLVLSRMQELDHNNKTRSADYKALDALSLKLRTPAPLTEEDKQDLHDKCF